jgi:hypothetical protein
MPPLNRCWWSAEERQARRSHPSSMPSARASSSSRPARGIDFDSTTRTIIDGRTTGFCKIIVDRNARSVVGCHVVGERAVEIAQVASIVIAARMRVDDLARVPLSFPTYAGVLGRLAASAARQLNLSVSWQADQVESEKWSGRSCKRQRRVAMLSFVVSSILAMGAGHTVAEILGALRNHRLITFALLANFVLMPLVALVLAKILWLDEPLGVGLLLFGSAAEAPFLPKLSQLSRGNLPFAVGAMVLLMIITIGFLPIVPPLLLPEVTVNPAQSRSPWSY